MARGGKGASWFRWSRAGLVFAATLILAGCGEAGGSEEGNVHKVSAALKGSETLYECLMGVSVQIAAYPRDLGLLRQARQRGGVIKVGSAYDKQEDVEGRLLVPRDGGSRRWMLWYLQPSGNSRTIEEIVRLRSHWYSLPPEDPRKMDPKYLERNIVIFKRRPSGSDRRHFQRCVPFPIPAR